MKTWGFANEIRQQPIHLARAALYLARDIAYPELDVDWYLELLHGLATAVLPRLISPAFIHTNAITLAQFLFEERGYRGNAAAYGDPRNSFLNDVVERGLGIPITLSVLYADVAQRLDIPAYGVGLPGHFIVAVGHDETKLLLDPFHNGRQLTLPDCARLVQYATGYDGPFQQEWLAPTPASDILVRMLNNLRIAYLKQESWAKATAVIQNLILLQPDTPEHLRDLGLIHYENNAPHLAAHYLDAYLQRVPDAADADAIRHGVRPTLDRWARGN